MLSIGHRRIENRNLIPLLFDILVACIVGSFPNNFNMIKLHVHDQESEHSDAYGLKYIEFEVISDCDEEENGRVWSCSLVDIADDGDKCDHDPEVLLMVGLHDDHAFKIEEEQYDFLEREDVLSHLFLYIFLMMDVEYIEQ